jgi:hypothetical protein
LPGAWFVFSSPFSFSSPFILWVLIVWAMHIDRYIKDDRAEAQRRGERLFVFLNDAATPRTGGNLF